MMRLRARGPQFIAPYKKIVANMPNKKRPLVVFNCPVTPLLGAFSCYKATKSPIRPYLYWEGGPMAEQLLQSHVQKVRLGPIPEQLLLEQLLLGWLFSSYAAFWNPPEIQALVHSVPVGKMIVLDLFVDVKPVWLRSENLYGVPYIWCMLHNYGGNIEMYGRLDAVDQ